MQARRKALADPDRFQIIMLLSDSAEGMTAKELAERIGKDTNRLYYHLRILESAGMVEAKESRPSGRMLERVFTFPDPHQRFTWDAKDPIEMSAYFGAQLALEKDRTEKVIFEQARRAEEGEKTPLVFWGSPGVVRTTYEEILEFGDRLQALLAEFRERRDKLQADGTPEEKLRDLSFYFILREEAASAET